MSKRVSTQQGLHYHQGECKGGFGPSPPTPLPGQGEGREEEPGEGSDAKRLPPPPGPLLSRLAATSHQPRNPQVRRSITTWLVRSALGIVVYALIIFLSAGRLDWVWGWALLGVLTAVMIAHPLILVPINPSLLAEREKGYWESGAKQWDKWITTAAGGLMPVPWILAGLDLRFGWTGQMPVPYHLAGLFATILGYALFMWAMGSNAFFTNTARLQEERGQVVTTGGPYRFMRHPGYAGTVLVHLATPFLLGSPWALIPGAASAVLFVARTYLEDRMLQAELPGYREYAQATRFRLVPGVW